MSAFPEGNAIIYCEGAFGTTDGKTAHGLVRRTARYRIAAVIDSTLAGRDAGEITDGKPKGVPVVASFEDAVATAERTGLRATHFVIGIAPCGGRLPTEGRLVVKRAIEHGLHVDSGLHDFLSDDPILAELAQKKGVQIRDIRKTPPRNALHAFTGKIDTVGALRIALLGTDSCVGKRTTAWRLVEAYQAQGIKAEMIGTGQTAWLQGVETGIILDSLINDFVAGELENAVVTAWEKRRPEVLIVEGQGSLMNPAFPGGLEILAATRPHAIVLQHAPARREYDGFPGFAMHPLKIQIQALELVSGRPVVAVTLNHQGIAPEEVPFACETIRRETGLPTVDPLLGDLGQLIHAVPRLRPGTHREDR